MIQHKPVLLNEIVKFFDNLTSDKEKIFGDFTLGFGGHSEEILKNFPNVKLIGIDRDIETLKIAKEKLSNFKERVSYYQLNFGDFDKVLNIKFDGVLLDLGVNSMQLISNERGFSFNSQSKLDMRMDRTQELSAWEVVNYYPPQELERVFREYADVKYPKRIVQAIIRARQKKKIDTCKELNDIINSFFKRRGRINPATKFFQAIRIEVNNELEELKKFLEKIWSFLNIGARLAIISFHSLEDRIVKYAFKRDGVKILTKKPITPSYEEIKQNPRARSAKLRVCEWQGF